MQKVAVLIVMNDKGELGVTLQGKMMKSAIIAGLEIAKYRVLKNYEDQIDKKSFARAIT